MSSRATTIVSADPVTTGAIGVLSGLSMLFVHEVLGHGIATIAFGAHVVRVTSVNESWNGDLSAPGARAIASAGIVANVLYGALALAAIRFVPEAHARTRFFLWFFGHATIFMGSGYLMTGAIFSFGDVPQTLHGLPFEIAWRAGAAAAGLAIFLVARVDAVRTLDRWSGNEGRLVRARVFSLVPYLAMGSIATLSGIAGPDARYGDVGWSALATFGACFPFAFLPLELRRTSGDPTPIDVRRSRGWIAAGIVALAILIFVLAPGLPR